tara:strand:+ start:92 stop:337 length:246 start_codon:yes stop_codon:yes gene_type:complete
MASRSPLRNRKDLTNLTMEAMALVNEEIMGPAVTDEEKYEELLENRKQRKAVSKIILIIFTSFLFRENNFTVFWNDKLEIK